MIEVHHLSKTYPEGNAKAVDDVSFNVSSGEIFGLIGPDGSGKTSIFRMLTTLLLPDSGSATVDGHDIVEDYKAIRSSIGYMPGRFSLYQDLTVAENINFFAMVFGTTLEENYDLVKDIYVQIEPFSNRRAGKLSGGMKQKLALCCALIHRPRVLFLDEPTTGVDPVSRREFWDMLQRLKAQQITILVSTPYMDEATRCDRIALIQNGKILSIETPHNVAASLAAPLFAVRADDMYQLLQHLQTYAHTQSSYAFGEYAHVILGNSDPQQLERWLQQQGLKQVSVHAVPPSVEDAFIKLLGN